MLLRAIEIFIFAALPLREDIIDIIARYYHYHVSLSHIMPLAAILRYDIFLSPFRCLRQLLTPLRFQMLPRVPRARVFCYAACAMFYATCYAC